MPLGSKEARDVERRLAFRVVRVRVGPGLGGCSTGNANFGAEQPKFNRLVSAQT